jgi:hypothetical protein
MSAIGEESLLPIAYDATGSVTQKLGRMMLQLEQIKNNGGGGGGGGGSTVISSGTISVQGISLDGALVSGSPVLLGVQGRNLLARTLHSYLAASGTVGANILAVGSLVQDETMTLWPIRQASAVSGTTGIGLQAMGPMICGKDGLFWSARGTIASSGTAGPGVQAVGGLVLGTDGFFWPAKGNNLAPFAQGPAPSGQVFSGNPFVSSVLDGAGLVWAAKGNALAPFVQGLTASGQAFTGNPLVGAAIDSQGNVSSLRVENSAQGNLKVVLAAPNTGGLILMSSNFADGTGGSQLPASMAGVSTNANTWNRTREVLAASGGVGTGLQGVGQMVQDPNGIWWPARQWVGVHGNAWASGAITSGAISAVVDCQGQTVISIFGTTNTINTFTVQMSQDNLAWYQTSFQIANVTGNFGASFTIGARWVRLVATGTSTVTATIAGKS